MSGNPTGQQRSAIELEIDAPPFRAAPDRRPRLPEPPPVRLLTVEDAQIRALCGSETLLDTFYVEWLEFQREHDERHVGRQVIYRAENFRLRVELLERPAAHDGLRSLGIEIRSLRKAEKWLIEHEWEYTRVRGLTPGQDRLTLLDPAGNWIEVSERRQF